MDNLVSNMTKNVFFFLLGLTAYHLFFKQKPEIITKIKTHTDTMYVQMPADTIYLTRDRLNHVVVRDTIIENFEPLIQAYSAFYQNQYGHLKITGEVFGEILNMQMIPDFRFPTVTNTITKTNTIIKKNQGLYVGPGFQVGGLNELSVSGDITYVRDKYLIGYSYSVDGLHSVRYSRKLF